MSQLSAGIQRRFKGDLVSDELMVAAALHPEFKLNWVPENEDCDDIRALLRTALGKISDSNVTTNADLPDEGNYKCITN